MAWHEWLLWASAVGGFGLGLYNAFWPKTPARSLDIERVGLMEFRLINRGRKTVQIDKVDVGFAYTDLPDGLFEIQQGQIRRFTVSTFESDPSDLPDVIGFRMRKKWWWRKDRGFMRPVPSWPTAGRGQQ